MEKFSREYEYKGYFNYLSHCTLHMMDRDGITFIGFEEDPYNPGTSVTNRSEYLASKVVEEYNLEPSRCRFFEWYPRTTSFEGDVDEITYTWIGHEATNPDWHFFCDAEHNPFNL